MRWIVGDLQGCARELDDLLRVIRFDPASDELWCAGDLVNRGPESLEALRLWRDVEGQAVLGNHDVHALLVHAGKRKLRPKDTLDALLAADDADALLERLRAAPILVRLDSAGTGPDCWLVHAGLHPRWTDLDARARKINDAPHDDAWLESRDVSFATNVRCCKPSGKVDRSSDAKCRKGYSPWYKHYRGELLVVHGHWATRGYHRRKRNLGLDNGCVYGAPLTAWCQDEDRIVQVPSRQPRRFG